MTAGRDPGRHVPHSHIVNIPHSGIISLCSSNNNGDTAGHLLNAGKETFHDSLLLVIEFGSTPHRT